MVPCPHCGYELTGRYCNMCGARAHEEIAAGKPRRAAPKVRVKTNSLRGPFARLRTHKWTVVALLGFALFALGLLVGLWVNPSVKASPAVAGSTTSPGAPTPAADQLAALPPITLAEQFMDQGVEYMKNGNRSASVDSFRKATAQFEKVLNAEPDNLYARSYLGLTYFYIGDAVKARSTEQEVLDKDPNYLWAIFNLAWIQESSGKTAEALLLYQQYLAVVPGERANVLKYAEQYELIDRQVEAAKKALANFQGGGGQ